MKKKTFNLEENRGCDFRNYARLGCEKARLTKNKIITTVNV